jgi:hypothetical protein
MSRSGEASVGDRTERVRVTKEMIEDAQQTALAKKKLPAISRLRHLILHEGRSAQVLHIGSYDDEAPVLHELHHTYLAAQGLRPSGLHHEVYLSDPRKTAPERLRTVLRQPVEDLHGRPSRSSAHQRKEPCYGATEEWRGEPRDSLR